MRVYAPWLTNRHNSARERERFAQASHSLRGGIQYLWLPQNLKLKKKKNSTDDRQHTIQAHHTYTWIFTPLTDDQSNAEQPAAYEHQAYICFTLMYHFFFFLHTECSTLCRWSHCCCYRLMMVWPLLLLLLPYNSIEKIGYKMMLSLWRWHYCSVYVESKQIK